MKKMTEIIRDTLQKIFLDTSITKKIHDIKGEVGAKALRGEVDAHIARRKIEKTKSFKLGQKQRERDIIRDYHAALRP